MASEQERARIDTDQISLRIFVLIAGNGCDH